MAAMQLRQQRAARTGAASGGAPRHRRAGARQQRPGVASVPRGGRRARRARRACARALALPGIDVGAVLQACSAASETLASAPPYAYFLYFCGAGIGLPFR